MCRIEHIETVSYFKETENKYKKKNTKKEIRMKYSIFAFLHIISFSILSLVIHKIEIEDVCTSFCEKFLISLPRIVGN